MDSEGSEDDYQAQPIQSGSASIPVVIQASALPAPTSTATIASTPTSTPPVGNAIASVISSETHDSKNRRAAFDKWYSTSDRTDDEVLGENLFYMFDSWLTNL